MSLHKISHLLKVLSSKRDTRRRITILQESRSIVTITSELFTTDRFVTFSSIDSRYACWGNVSLLISRRSLCEKSKELSRLSRPYGRKVADAGLRRTDREESRLPPPVLKAHVDGSHGALASFRSSASARDAIRMEVRAPGFADVKPQTLWKTFIKAFVTKWQISLKLT